MRTIWYGGMQSDNSNEFQTGSNFAVNRRSVLKSIGAAGALGGVATRSFSGDAAAASSMENPVYEPVLADPSIIQADDGTYYAYGTEDDSPAWGCDGTEWIPIVTSTDLETWEYIGNAFDTKPSWKSDAYLWAPDINYYDGTYYLYYSYSQWGDNNPGIGVATSDTPDGPFDDQGKVFDDNEIGVDNSIDPCFHVVDSTPYMVWGSYGKDGIYRVELTSDGTDWVSGTKEEIASDAYEGAFIWERNGYYYLFVSSGSCCEGHSSTYKVNVGRSDSFFGPYTGKDGTDLLNDGATLILEEGAYFAGPGHNAVFTDDNGQDWLIYHAYDKSEPEYVCNDEYPRRSLMLDTIDWVNGWPEINNGTPWLFPTMDNQVSGYSEFMTDGSVDATFYDDEVSAPYRITAAGTDVWEGRGTYEYDDYGAIYDPDGVGSSATITTQITRQDWNSDYAKAGIMVRNDITKPGQSTGYVKVQINADHGFALDWDSDENGYADSATEVGTPQIPCSLKLVKDNTTFDGYYSTDGGSTWNYIDSCTVSSADSTQDVGLFNCGHDDTYAIVEYEYLDVV